MPANMSNVEVLRELNEINLFSFILGYLAAFWDFVTFRDF